MQATVGGRPARTTSGGEGRPRLASVAGRGHRRRCPTAGRVTVQPRACARFSRSPRWLATPYAAPRLVFAGPGVNRTSRHMCICMNLALASLSHYRGHRYPRPRDYPRGPEPFTLCIFFTVPGNNRAAAGRIRGQSGAALPLPGPQAGRAGPARLLRAAGRPPAALASAASGNAQSDAAATSMTLMPRTGR